MTRSRLMRLSLVILVLAFIASAAQAQIGAVVPNWSVPSTWSPSSDSGGLHHARTLVDVTNAIPFIGVTPCRIVDTRLAPGPYGGPSLPASTPRSFALLGGPCAGLPAGVQAYSLNITVTNTLGPGFISLYPTGGAAPLVSTLNYVAGQTIANAAIVPAGTGGAITAVAGVSGTDLIIDINGYFAGNDVTAKNVNFGAVAIAAFPTCTNYTSITVNAPVAGIVFVRGDVELQLIHVNGTRSEVVPFISASASTCSTSVSGNIFISQGAAAPSDTYYFPVSISGRFPVSAGSNTFYLNAQKTSGASSNFFAGAMEAKFVPN